MKNTKLLVVSALGALVSVGALVGGTFAIFTSEAKTDIAVTSGKVSVSAEIQDLKLYSGEWNDVTNQYDSIEVANGFTNGGSAVLEDGSLKLDKISAMDKATFKIHVKNNSNIQAKYKITTKLTGDFDLFAALDVKINNEKFLGFTTSSEWTMMTMDYEEDIEVEVGLPEDAGNEAQGKNININFAVEAVQGNAHTEELDLAAGELPLYTESDLRLFASYVNNGEIKNTNAVLMDDIDLGGVEWNQIKGANKNIGFNGKDHTISNLKISEGHDAGFFATAYGCTVENVTFDHANVQGVGRIAVAVGHGLCAHINNVTVKNSKVKAIVENNDDGDKAGAIVGYLSAESNAEVIDSKVESCVVEGYRDIGGAIGYAGGTYQIKNVEVKDTKLINNRINNYKNYANDAEFDVNEVIGEDRNQGTKENIVATNVTKEVVYNVNSAEDLQAFAAEVNNGNSFSNKLVSLKSDIDLAGIAWTPIGNLVSYPSDSFAGTFDGEEHVISNMKTSDFTPDYATAGLFGSLVGTIKNITLKDFEVKSSHYAAAFVGYASQSMTIENCKAINGAITSSPELIGHDYDNGDKVGGIIGYGTAGTISNCLIDGVTVTAYRDLGGIAGAFSGTISNCQVMNSTICQDNTNGYKTSVDTYHEILGRDLGATLSGNTFQNVIVKSI